jgi:GAF domain-containing protein
VLAVTDAALRLGPAQPVQPDQSVRLVGSCSRPRRVVSLWGAGVDAQDPGILRVPCGCLEESPDAGVEQLDVRVVRVRRSMSDGPDLVPDATPGSTADGDRDDALGDHTLARPPVGLEVIDAALRLVTTLASATVENADGVSVTLERQGRLMTVAASNDDVVRMDEHQYTTGEGPCLSAKADGRRFYIESLDVETRWPAFIPLALEQGIHSILSSPLMSADRPLGALNIYSNKQRAFNERDQGLASLFATQASDVLTRAHADIDDEQQKRRWSNGLAGRRAITLAQGVLMRDQHVSATAAERILIRSARAAQLTVLQYATRLLSPYDDDDDHPGRSGP